MSIIQIPQEEKQFLRRSSPALTVLFVLMLGCAGTLISSVVLAQQPTPTNPPDIKNAPKTEKGDKNAKTYTAEQIAESSIYLYGSRTLLAQIRRNGVERGRICKPTCEVGKTEEAAS